MTTYEPPIPRRICQTCGESKPASDFGMMGGGRPATCKACRAKANAEYQRKRRAFKPELNRAMNLWRLYKITEQEYDDLRTAQDHRCAVCLIHEDDIDTTRQGGRPRQDGTMGTRFALQVDHCHDRDAIRGLLCGDCNIAVGRFGENVDALQRAVEYLQREPVLPIDRARPRRAWGTVHPSG